MLRLQWAVVLCCVFGACDGGGGKDSLSALGVDDGASEGVSTSEVVDGSKDVRLTLDTGALVDVPAGAVSKDVKISVERPADSKALKLVENLKSPGRIVSAPYVLTPHGTTFKEDVTVTLPISKDSDKDLTVAWLENEKDTKWKFLGVPKSNGEKAAITLKHFSVLLLVEGDEDLAPMEEEDEPDTGALDGGIDAAVRLDAGVDLPEDAGRGPLDDDARVRFDAAPLSDGALAPSDAGPVGATSFYGRLQQCNLLTRTGAFQEPQAIGPYQHCYFDCWARGSCEDIRLFACGDIDAVDAGISQELAACWQACQPGVVQCPDQTTAVRCDGYPTCTDRSDEANCGDLYFQCDATLTIFGEQRCDGYPDCDLGQDEQNCPHHICTSTGLMLPPDTVCDGYDDCGDGSDEPATCAQLVCTAPTSPPASQSVPAQTTQTVAQDAGVR